MICTLISTVVIVLAQERSPEAVYQEAWYRELAEGRVREALEAYQALASRPDLPASFRAKALFRSGVCLRKLQKKEDARATFDRVLKDFADVTDVSDAARREIAGETEAEAALRKKAEVLIPRLSDKDEKARKDAVYRLVSLGSSVVPQVLAVLGGSDPLAADEAAKVLAMFATEDRSLVPSILGALRSGDDSVRQSMRIALRIEAASFDPVSLGWTEDASSRVRSVGAELLGVRLKPEGLDALKKLLKDPDPEVRRESVGSIASLVGSNIESLLGAYADADPGVREDALFWVNQKLKDAGARFDPASTIALLDDPNSKVSNKAVMVLATRQAILTSNKMGTVLPEGETGTRALESLTRIARGDGRGPADRVTREQAITLLGASGRSETVAALVALTKDPDPQLRTFAVNALGTLGDKSALPALIDLLQEPALGDAAWKVITKANWHVTELETFVSRLPDLGGDASRIQNLLSTASQAGRDDLLMAATRHFDALSPGGRATLLKSLPNSRLGECLPVVVKGLDDPASIVRSFALNPAEALADRRLVPGLVRCLEDSDRGVRMYAAGILQQIGDRSAGPALVARLADADQGVSHNAGNALVAIADVSLIAPVLEVLKKPDLVQPDPAVNVLARIARPEDATAVAEAIPVAIPRVRVLLLDLLARLKNPAVLPAVRARLADDSPEARVAAVKALAAIGGDVLDDLVRALGDQESSVRKAAAEALAGVDAAKVRAHASAVQELIAALDDSSWETRAAVVAALGHAEDRRAVPALIEAVKSGGTRQPPRDSRPRRIAVPVGPPVAANGAKVVLLRLGDHTVVTPMLEVLISTGPANPWLTPDDAYALIEKHATAEDAAAIAAAAAKVEEARRPSLVRLLARVKGPRVVELARPFLSDSSDSVRKAAIEALRSWQDPAIVPVLLEVLRTEKDGSVQADIVDALELYARPDVIPALMEALKTPPHTLSAPKGEGPGKYAGLWTLLRYPPADALKALLSVLEMDVPESLKAEAVRVLARVQDPAARGHVLKLLASPASKVRRQVAVALGDAYDARSLPKLLELLRDPQVEVRTAAKEAIDEIRFFLETSKLADAGSGTAGATAELIKQLADPTPAVRAAAAKSLGRIHASEAMTALVRARKDADADVRAAVEEALDALTREEDKAK